MICQSILYDIKRKLFKWNTFLVFFLFPFKRTLINNMTITAEQGALPHHQPYHRDKYKSVAIILY